MGVRKLLFGCAMGLVLVGCEKGGKAPVEESKPQAGPAMAALRAVGHTATVALQMDTHRKAARAVMNAVVAGDFPELQKAAGNLSVEGWTPALKGEWKVHQGALQKAAGQLKVSRDVKGVKSALGALGSACANCHQLVGRAPVAPPPQEEWSTLQVSPAMREHYRAAVLMWDGLTGPSEVAWTTGAELMQSADWVRSDVEDIEVLVRRVNELGAQAKTAKGAARGQLVGELLATCGECHDSLGVSAQVKAYLKLASLDNSASAKPLGARPAGQKSP